MHIPRSWTRVETDVESPKFGPTHLFAWGWGDDEAAALREAETRLSRFADRVRRGESFPPRGYEYGKQPVREEILETIGPADAPRAVLTRNRYGATVLNAERLLFLDVDLPEGAGAPAFLGKLFGMKSKEATVLEKLRTALEAANKGAFRIYRTAAGFRALAPAREFDPAGREAQDLMNATGTDPYFVKLCLAQKCFRARLTPKPWRVGLKAPDDKYPRSDPEAEERFEAWLEEYEAASKGFATCRYLETVGKGGFVGADGSDLVDLHDRATRANEALPLA
jgi:hypothetical protein